MFSALYLFLPNNFLGNTNSGSKPNRQPKAEAYQYIMKAELQGLLQPHSNLQ